MSHFKNRFYNNPQDNDDSDQQQNSQDQDQSKEEPSGNSADDLEVDFGDAFDDNGAEEPVKEAEDELSALKKELAEAKDKTLRTFAELENFRKRSARTLQDELKYANMSLIRDMLPVMDNLLRAIEAAEKQDQAGELTEQGKALLDGVKMVVEQFNTVLAKHNCTPIEAVNQPFDPNFHQAITQMPSADVAPNTVLMETQKGYVLHDRVVRPSQVIVSCEAPKE
ncbi:MAG: nucleotide exchange factor GrpE [Thermoguttaceae bacterium]|nr:nucleotide exchange factor GrpE [Thermoguttaceae bacterium]